MHALYHRKGRRLHAVGQRVPIQIGIKITLRNIQQGEQVNDFAHAEPVKSIRQIKRLAVDEDGWTNRARALSSIFAGYPDVKTSGVAKTGPKTR